MSIWLAGGNPGWFYLPELHDEKCGCMNILYEETALCLLYFLRMPIVLDGSENMGCRRIK